MPGVGAPTTSGSIRVIFMRPEAGERVAAGITFDLEGTDAAFDEGAEELSVYNLYVENTYEHPNNWDEACLGEFSQAKAAFIVTILQTNLTGVYDWKSVNVQLRKALEAYNAEHPDAPKDFTFPENSKPDWWDGNKDWLGEYSDDKEIFIREKVGAWDQWTNWEMYSLVLGYYYDQDPDAGYSFLRTDFRSLEEPDWWATYQQWLGVFSIPKAIFFEQGLYLGTGIWETGASYPWEGQMSYIKQQYKYYFYNPQTQPYFEDDFVVPASAAPSWWAEASGYLGAYSEAKKEFLQTFFKDEKGEWWEKEAPGIDDWSVYINDLIDAYKSLEKPEFDNDFDPNGEWKDPGKDDGKGDDKK